MFKSISLVVSLLLILITTGCSPKASDSDVGRVKQADGFRIKTFLTVTISPVSDKTLKTVKSKMSEFSMSQSSSMEINKAKTVKYYSEDNEKMVALHSKNGQMNKVVLEGLQDFTDSVINNIKDKASIKSRALLNAKKTFAQDIDKAKKIVSSYIKTQKLSQGSSSRFNDTETIEYNYGEMRIVTEISPEHFMLIVEGKDKFVDGLREKVKGMN
jgi:hypothetical protein